MPLTWRLTGFHGFFQVNVGLETFTKPAGGSATYSPILTEGPQNCCTEPSGGFDYAGSTTVTVQAGDEFGFRISGSNYDTTNVLQGTLKVGLNTVANGGFEQLPVINTATYDTVPAGSAQLAPWEVSSGSVDHIGQYWTAAEGVQSLDLDGSAPGAIRQSVPTVAGHTYRVAFSYSANPDRSSGTPGMVVKADGTTLDTFTHAYDDTRPSITWDRGETSFTAQEIHDPCWSSRRRTPAAASGSPSMTCRSCPISEPKPSCPASPSVLPAPVATTPSRCELAQGASEDITIPVNLTGGATGVAVGVTSVTPDESGRDRDHGRRRHGILDRHGHGGGRRHTRRLRPDVTGAVGAATDSVTLYVTVLPAPVDGRRAAAHQRLQRPRQRDHARRGPDQRGSQHAVHDQLRLGHLLPRRRLPG